MGQLQEDVRRLDEHTDDEAAIVPGYLVYDSVIRVLPILTALAALSEDERAHLIDRARWYAATSATLVAEGHAEYALGVSAYRKLTFILSTEGGRP